MAKELTEKEKLDIIRSVLGQNGISYEEFIPFLSTKLESSDTILYAYDQNGFEYSKIVSFFKPKKETINIAHIIGLNYEKGTFLDALLNIYRSDVIYNNLGNFSLEEFNKTLEKSNFSLLEKNNKYSINNDGNHRALLMLFQYALELMKLYKNNATDAEIRNFQNKMKITVPVYHVDNHNLEMLNKFYDNSSSPITENNIKSDFLHKHIGKNLSTDRYLQYNKETSTYNLFYKGILNENLTPEQVIKKIDNINNMNPENDFIFDSKTNSFVVANKHIGLANVPTNALSKCSDFFSFLKFPEFGVDYFISGHANNSKTFSLDIASKDYGNIDVNYKKIEQFVKEHSDILCSDRVDNSDEEIFTCYNYLTDLHYKNISLQQAFLIIKTINKLNDTIIPKR